MSTAAWSSFAPLAEREMLVGLRKRRTAITQFITLVITSIAAVGVAAANHAFSDVLKQGPDPFGREMFVAVLTALSGLLILTAPALTATSISEERERRTLDLLLCTRLRPGDIVLGKFTSGMVQGLMVVAASVPAACFSWLYGGVALWHLVVAYAAVALLLAMLLAAGLFGSARATLSKAAISSTYGVNLALMLPIGLPALGGIGVAYATGKAPMEVAASLALGSVVMLWCTSAALLASVTGISPASHDPAPAARKNLLFIVTTGMLAAGLVGGLESTNLTQLTVSLLLALAFVLTVASLIFATEDPPVRTDVAASVLWRGNPLVGVLFYVGATVVAATAVPSLALRNLDVKPVTMSGCMALVPFFASCAGVASLTRLLPIRRGLRQGVALAGLMFVLFIPPVLAFITGHQNLTAAPSFMLLWLHPGVMLDQASPSTVSPTPGPFGLSIPTAFMLGHLAIAAVTLVMSQRFGTRSPRAE
ncbi:MAG: ABC transporter permease [Myxococcota bacterium]